jgi:hypothetical protein
MTETTTYNGWKNWETWCVNLWLTNEPGTDEALSEFVQMDVSLYERSEALKEWITEMAPIDGANMFTDLLRGALDNVDWREIIKNHEDDYTDA